MFDSDSKTASRRTRGGENTMDDRPVSSKYEIAVAREQERIAKRQIMDLQKDNLLLRQKLKASTSNRADADDMAKRCAILENRIRVLTRENSDLTEVTQNYAEEIERLVKEATKPLYDEIRRLKLELETTRNISAQYQTLNSQLIAASPRDAAVSSSGNVYESPPRSRRTSPRRRNYYDSSSSSSSNVIEKGDAALQEQHNEESVPLYNNKNDDLLSSKSSNNNMLPSPRRRRRRGEGNDSAANLLLRTALPTPVMSQRSYDRVEHDEIKQRMFDRIDAVMRRNPPRRTSPSTSHRRPHHHHMSPSSSSSRRSTSSRRSPSSRLSPRSNTSESKRTNWSSRILRKTNMRIREGGGGVGTLETTPIVRIDRSSRSRNGATRRSPGDLVEGLGTTTPSSLPESLARFRDRISKMIRV